MPQSFKRVPALHTPRTIIRRVQPADWADLLAFYHHPTHFRYIQSGKTHWTLAEIQEKWAKLEGNEGDGIGLRVIELKETDQIIGECGLLHLARSPGEVELGYVVSNDFWGQGYATEVAGELVQFGFSALGLSRILAMTRKENTASMRVLKKVGFEKLSQPFSEKTTGLISFSIENG